MSDVADRLAGLTGVRAERVREYHAGERDTIDADDILLVLRRCPRLAITQEAGPSVDHICASLRADGEAVYPSYARDRVSESMDDPRGSVEHWAILTRHEAVERLDGRRPTIRPIEDTRLVGEGVPGGIKHELGDVVAGPEGSR